MIIKSIRKALALSILLLWGICCFGAAQNQFPFKIEHLKDESGKLGLNQLSKMSFDEAQTDILNFGASDATFWIRLTTDHNLIFNNDLIFVEQSRFSSVTSYYQLQDQKLTSKPIYSVFKDGDKKNNQGYAFTLPNKFGIHDTVYLKLKPHEVFITKISIVTENQLLEKHATRDIIFGIYTGVMLIMFVYNLFLFVVVRDRSYIFYVFYILFTWLAQISIQGYGLRYIWDLNSFIDQNSVILYSLLGLIFACLFTISFLNTKLFSPISHKLFNIYLILVLINLGILFAFGGNVAFIVMQVLTLSGAAIAMYASYHVYFKKHFKPAGFYLIAWSILLVGAVFFVLKDYGIVPYNTFTTYLLQICSAIEVMLLSFALADKINYFKKENETAQAQALNASLENQRLIKEQNVVLERKVKERTEELESANETLNETLHNLKSTQSQLVDAEKMAALGQLTAGIAHEINNPINFVTSNVKPLQLDIDDLKDIIKKYENIDLDKDVKPQIEEIEAYKRQIDLGFINNEITSLLSGISEGAKRTAEIIRSLRNFSRVDETDMKAIDLNEGLLSTLVLIRNTLPDNLTVVKDLGNLPKVECMPGKINQVFMNLVSNAVQAIKSKETQEEEEFLTIRSWYSNQQVYISIKDSGTGMSDEVKHRIFEPFFTTKDIGEGTGLGLSIVFSIIEKHKGHIEVISEVGKGTEFIITLQVNIL
ncbi:MAG: 7TM diverse intracellular signaling domain-containing protein [Pedobacter sp.]|uniref:sensor histidine kinase n=1 Tax=Pedobacter sp. TaxID=1411316 RepID=UPI00280686EF|nr:7TM diverse intracellular signaling domain-containing protein [Pedobacter sp.]MDQ8004146.1 7TM diverse intracellular signaling domain-containing protein [Pedobacter sp.]